MLDITNDDRPAAASDVTPQKKGYLTRQDVLLAARKIIRRQGYHGTSIQDIADALGIRKSSVYHHIKSKQDMLYQILDEALGADTQGIAQIASSNLPPTRKLELALAHHISTLIEHFESVSILYREPNSLEPPYRDIYLPKRKHFERLFRRIIDEGIDVGEFSTADSKITAFAVLGMCNWLVHWYDPEGELSAKEIVERLTALAKRMLLCVDSPV